MVKNITTKSDVKYAPISFRYTEEDKELAELIENQCPPTMKKSTFVRYLLNLGAKYYKRYEQDGEVDSSNSEESTQILELQAKLLDLTEQLKVVVDENNTLIKSQTIMFNDLLSNKQPIQFVSPVSPSINEEISSNEVVATLDNSETETQNIQSVEEENIQEDLVVNDEVIENDIVNDDNNEVDNDSENINNEEEENNESTSFLDGDGDEDEDISSFTEYFNL